MTPTTTVPSSTPLTVPGSDAGVWRATHLTITPTALGSVQAGTTLAQAQFAAGIAFDGQADGAFYPTKLPSGFPHLFVHLSPGVDGKIICVGAEIDPGGTNPQTVETPEGFRLGGTVEQLQAIYGSRLLYRPAPTGGISPHAGYVVQEPTGDLAFLLDNTRARIVGIKGAPPIAISVGGTAFYRLTPSSCNG